MCAAASKSRPEPFVGGPQVVLDAPAIGHVTNGRNDERTFVRLDRAETDVEWKLHGRSGAGRAGPNRTPSGASRAPGRSRGDDG